MGYRQFWVSGDVVGADLKDLTPTIGPCYGSLPFDSTKHTVFHIVQPKCADKHIELLNWLGNYFKFKWEQKDAVRSLCKRGCSNTASDGVGFAVSFDDRDFVSKAHRLFFLTLCRGCHEHPSTYMQWDVATGLEGLLALCTQRLKDDKYDYCFTYELGDGHTLLSSYQTNLKRFPSMETALVKFLLQQTNGVQATCASLKQGKK